MPINVSRILIVDDKREDGIKIAQSIWNSGYPVRFIEYPGGITGLGANKLQGVRVIFMDINLLGAGGVGDDKIMFSTVQGAIKAIINDNNGPYVLITWSEHDELAEELFKYLTERMLPGMRPAISLRLDKANFMADSYEADLSTKISEYLTDMGPTGCLINWEKCIVNAASETLHGLIDLSYKADGAGKIEVLTRLMYDISRAEAGDNLTEDNSTAALYLVLSQLLHDNNLHQISGNEGRCGELIYSGGKLDTIANIHQKINTMLHLETRETSDTVIHSPGDVFNYPDGAHGLPIPEINISEFLKEEFKNIKGDLSETDLQELKTSAQLLLVEITPPCDFSNNKHTWNKYIVIAKIPAKFVNVNKKKIGYIFPSPEFKYDDSLEFKLFFNSKLVVSLPKNSNLGRKLFRIRQPLLGDMMGWLARQSSRLGHVAIQ